ncbi:unnamed protein product [Amoebophrya sp. A25]|nr:unnamed protein product [Amoebophrya sp. A25]|eukprot:GSA25T00000107001.1
MNPEPVRNLGPWSFTIQQETPVHWLRTGPMESYLLKCEVEAPAIEGALVSTGVLLHSGDDVLGGGSVWMEVNNGRKVYCLGGNELASKPIVTQSYPVTTVVRGGRNVIIEEWEFLLQGFTGCAFFDSRKVRIKFSLKRGKGAIAFFNSSKGPAWENQEMFDQIFSGVDVLFRDIRLTVVAKKVELDSFLKHPQVQVTAPQKKVKELWNDSEVDTQRKRAERRAELLAPKDEKGGPPEPGDVGPELLGENVKSMEELEDDLMKGEPVFFSHKYGNPVGSSSGGGVGGSSGAGGALGSKYSRFAEERRRKTDKNMNLVDKQRNLVENMGESVLFSSSSSSSNLKGTRNGGSLRNPLLRAQPKSEKELLLERQEYNDEWFKKSENFGLYAQEYRFGMPPDSPGKGQHTREREREFNQPRGPSPDDLERWRKAMEELRSKPQLPEIAESELMAIRRRLKDQLELIGERIAKSREELTELAKKRGLAEEKHPREVQQKIMSRQLEVEQKLSRDQREEVMLMEKIREVDIEVQDLRSDKPSVRDLLPPVLQKMLDEDEARAKPAMKR